MQTTLALAVTILCAYSHIFINAFPFAELQSRQTDAECTSKGEVYRSSCWDKYDVSNYVLQWNATYSKRPCGTVNDPLDCETHKTCLADEPWSTCFLRLAENQSGQSCTSLDGEGCDKNSKLDPNLDPSILAQVRYVVRSIYMVEAFFGSYFTALGQAIANVNLAIGTITRTIDPKQSTGISLTTLLTTLTVGLSFLTAPALGAAAISSVEHAGLQKAASVWATSLAQSPGVAKSIWPQGSEESITYQINQLQDQVKTITEGYTNSLDNGLKTIMLDPNEFVHFADHGAYAVNNPLDIIDSLNATELAFLTYLVSESMSRNKWYIIPGKTSTKDEFDSDYPLVPPCNPGPLGRCIQPGSVRDQWYWSPTTTRRYHLRVHNDPNVSPLSPGDMMGTIVNNGWTTLDILFDGAYECALKGPFDANNALRLDPVTNAIDTTCISHLPVNTPCGGVCPVAFPEGQTCPFPYDCDPHNCIPGLHGYCQVFKNGPPSPGGPPTGTSSTAPSGSSTPQPKICAAAATHGGPVMCQHGTGPGSGSSTS